MFPSWRNWFRRTFSLGSKSKQRPHCRLGVEALEDRTAPAALGGVLDKLGNNLGALVSEYQAYATGVGAQSAFHSSQGANLKLVGDKLLVEIHAQGDWSSELTKLAGCSFKLTSADTVHKLIDGYLPLGQAVAAASLPGTLSIMPLVASLTTDSQGTVSNAAEGTLKADVARHLFGVDGAGITVGVISDSANDVGAGIAASQATLNLPAGSRVQDLLDQPGGADEGRAMMELIYDIAPGVNLKFASGQVAGGGSVTDASMANAVNVLVASGVNIIVDDLNGLTSEPYFQDGLAAQAVTNAIAGGVSYFSSAGNRGLSGYEAPFHGFNTTVAGITGRWNDFGGTGGDPTQTVTLQPGTSFFVFQYDDPYYGGTGVTHDADFYILNAAGTAVLASGTNNNLTAGGTGIPREIVSVTVGAVTTAQIAVRDVAGGDIGRFKYIAFNAPTIVDHLADPGAINNAANPGHNGVAGVITVAAASVATPTTPESFTAQGPVTRVFDAAGNPIALQIRNKPDVTSNDGANTSVPGFAPFFGTSAAAPNAAAVGALIKQYHPSLTPAQLKTLMMNTAQDIFTAGYDFRTGAGLINAVSELQNTTGSPVLNGDFDFANEGDTFLLNVNSGDPTKIDVTVNGTPLGFYYAANVTSIRVMGLGGNDIFTPSGVNGDILVPISFDGGAGANTLSPTGMTGINRWLVNGANAGTFSLVKTGPFIPPITFLNTQNLIGTAQRDLFVFTGAGALGGIINGNGGGDFLDYSGKASPVVVNLNTGAATFTGLVLNVQNVIGSANGGDTLIGNAAGNVLVGHGGGNTIVAGSGRSLLIGGFGVNRIIGGASGDLLINGRTSYDADYLTLANILTIWQDLGQTYAQRIAALQAAGSSQLKIGLTVFVFPGIATRKPGLGLGRAGTGTAVNSSLTGGGGINDERNWFITNSTTTVTDRKTGEVVTTS